MSADGKIVLYTYQEIADLFRVRIRTVRNWAYTKQFKVYRYRRVGPFTWEAVVKEDEVKLLMDKKFRKELNIIRRKK